MDISLSNNEEILMNLLTIIPIVPICKDIIQFKNKMEKEDTLNYHVERWVTISSKYFRSFEMIDNKQIYRPSDISPFQSIRIQRFIYHIDLAMKSMEVNMHLTPIII